MTAIDRRVVEMGFDNKQFESGVGTTVKSLDNLKKSLNLENAAKGLTNLSNVGKSFSLAGIADGVQNISSKFSALGVVGLTVLQNLTNSVINLGQKLLSSMIVTPLKTGLQEYETQINAIQTVLANTASKGTTLDQVNKALDKLNEYSDKTIYNFTQMAKNIGTFTAAGIDLETSVTAIKGIANLAAVSGSSAEQASVVMYQLSQALQSGTVKLMDWNSVISGGMGGQVFQDALKETARVHKINIDAMIKKEGSFRETLQKGWLSSEILTETLSKFTGDLTAAQLKSMGYTEKQITEILKLGKIANEAATKVKTFSQLTSTINEAIQSGWAQSFRIVVGDFEEARTLFTEISDILGGMVSESSKSRNELLQGWKDFGGRTVLIQGIRDAFEGLLSIIKPIKDAFRNMFPAKTGADLALLTYSITKFAAKLKIGADTADKIQRTFSGVAAVIDIFLMGIKELIKVFLRLTGSVVPSTNSILDFTAKLGDWLVILRGNIKWGNAFGKFFERVKTFLEPAANSFKTFVNTVEPLVNKIKSFLTETFKNIDISGIDKFAVKIGGRFEPLTKLIQTFGKVFSWLGKVFEKLSPIFYKVGSILAKNISDLGMNILDSLEKLDYNKIFDALNEGLIVALFLAIKKFIQNGSGVLDGVSGVLSSIGESLKIWQSSLKAKTLMTIATAIGILAISVIALSLVDSEKLSASLTAITIMFGQLVGAMAMFDKIPGGGGVAKVAAQMILLSGAILLLSAAVVNLSRLNPEDLTKGLISVGVVLGQLALFSKLTDTNKAGGIKGGGLLVLALAINLLGIAVKKFSELDPGKLQQGLLAIAAILGELAIFTRLTGNSQSLIASAVGMTIIGSAMIIFGEAIGKIGSMPLDQIGKGLLGMAGGLLIIVGAMRLLPTNILGNSLALIAIALSLKILAKSLSSMGSMSWEEIAKGLVALAGSLGIIAIAMKLMTSALPGAAALLVVAAALTIFVPVLRTLGQMSLQEIGTGLLALAGSFAVLGLAGLILGPLTPVLLGLSAAMLIFGLALLAVGAGTLAFSTGLASLALSGAAGAAALQLILMSIVAIIPMIAVKLAEGIISFATTIANGAGVLAESVKTVVLQLIKTLSTLIPDFARAALELLTTLLQELANNLPKIVQAGMDMLVALLQGVADNIGRVVASAVAIVTEFLEALGRELPKIVEAGYTMLISLLNGISDAIDKNSNTLVQAGVRIAGSIINAVVNAIKTGAQAVLNALGALIQGAIDQLWRTLTGQGQKGPQEGFAEDLGKNIDKSIAKGITNNSNIVENAVQNASSAAVISMSKTISKISDAVSTNIDINPTIRPVVDLTDIINGSQQINSLLNGKQLDISMAIGKLSNITANGIQISSGTSEVSKEAIPTNAISFTQNNYSPKALSRLEIYRQTRNQLAMKGLANA